MKSLTVRVSLPTLIPSVYKLPHRHDQRSILKNLQPTKRNQRGGGYSYLKEVIVIANEVQL